MNASPGVKRYEERTAACEKRFKETSKAAAWLLREADRCLRRPPPEPRKVIPQG